MTEGSDLKSKPWTIKGIPPEVRKLAVEAAGREGKTIGDWVGHAIRLADQSSRKQAHMWATVRLPPIYPSDPRSTLDALERLGAVVQQTVEATPPPPMFVQKLLYARIWELMLQMEDHLRFLDPTKPPVTED